MRNGTLILAAVALVAVGALGMRAFAGDAAAEPADRSHWRPDDRFRALEFEVRALQARDAAYTAWFAEHTKRANAFEAVLRAARAQGFTSAAISTRSRVTLLNGLEAMAKSMRTGLPLPTEEDEAAAKALQDFVGAATARQRKPIAEPATDGN